MKFYKKLFHSDEQQTRNMTSQQIQVSSPIINHDNRVCDDVTNQHQRDVTNQRQRDVTNQHQRDVTNQHQRDVTNQHQRDVTNQHQRDVTNQHQRDVTYDYDLPNHHASRWKKRRIRHFFSDVIIQPLSFSI